MKKTLTVLLALVILLMTLAGCNNGNNTTTTTTTTPPPSPVSDFEYETNQQGDITITNYIGLSPEVVIPSEINEKKVTQIGKNCFRQNKIIISVTLLDSIDIIGDGAFCEAPNLVTVILSKSLKSIGVEAFENCTNLSNIVLPKSLTNIGARAFANCTSLKCINIPGNCLNETSWESFHNSGLEIVYFEEGVEIIPNTAFAATNITYLVLPQSVRIIERQAFAGCTNLESVALNNGLITIDSLAFGGKSKITEIIIPATVKNITERTFSGCSTLERVMFEGNAPDTYVVEDLVSGGFVEAIDVYYTIYYHSNAKGFSSPRWYGYPTAIW